MTVVAAQDSHGGSVCSLPYRTIPFMLEDLNKSAKKVGLHVAAAKKDGRYSIRKAKNGKLVAKNIDEDEAAKIIKKYK